MSRLASPWSFFLAASLTGALPACSGEPPPAVASPAVTPRAPASPVGRPAWIARSDDNARLLLAVEVAFYPESASRLGEEAADPQTIDLAPDFRPRRAAALADARRKLEARRSGETDPLVLQDLSILLHEAELGIRELALEDRLLVRHWDVARHLVFLRLHQAPRPARRSRAEARGPLRRPGSPRRHPRRGALASRPPARRRAEEARRRVIRGPGLLRAHGSAVPGSLDLRHRHLSAFDEG